MAITLASNFDQTAAVPLDSRTVVADLTARDAIASGVRYEGLTVYVVADAKNYQLVGGIANGDWTELQGAGGGINYILAPDGTDITGWAAYADAAGTSPVDGTGGSPATTFAVSTDSSLVGTENFVWTKSAADRQGEGFSQAFTIDSAYQSKPMTISALYKVASGTYADNDMSIWVYDVTNAVLIQPSAYQIKNSTGVEQIKCEFQASSNSTSYRLIFHTASTSASAYTLRFDSFSVSPNTYNSGAGITDWKLESGFTFTGLGTVTGTSVWVRREGDKVRVRGITTAGTVAASTCSIQPPTYLTLDSSKFASTTNAQDVGTFFTRRGTSAAIYNGGLDGVVFYDGTTTNQLFLAQTEGGTSGQFTKANGSTLFATGSGVSFSFEYPVLGWASAQVLSSETDTRIVDFDAVKSAGAVSTTTTIPTWTVVNKDSHGAFNSTTGIYTVPVAGDYFVSGHITLTTSASWALGIIKNGSLIWYGPTVSTYINTTVNKLLTGLVAGDQISLALSANATVTTATAPYSTGFSMLRLSGPAQIAASEKVFLQYTGNAGTAVTLDVTDVPFTTKVSDSHGAWSGTLFTAPRAGWYDFKGGTLAGSTAGAAQLYINTVKKLILNSDYTSDRKPFSGGWYMNAGETASIRMSVSSTLSNSATLHWLSITSQG